MTDDIPRTLEPSEAERLATLRAAMTHGGAGGVSRTVGQVLQRGMVRAIVNDLVGDGDDSLEVRWHFSEVLKDVGAAPVTDYELTFNPVDDPHWPQVFVGGALQTPGVDYEINGRVLTVLAPMRLRAEDPLRVDFDYLAAVPSTPGAHIVDTFERADTSVALGVPTSGTEDAWIESRSVWGITSGEARPTSVSVSSGTAVLECGSGDGTVTVTVGAWNDSRTGIVLRQSDDTLSGLTLLVSGLLQDDPTFDDDGTATTIHDFGTPFSAGDVIRVVMDGDEVTAYLNGASLGTATGVPYGSNTKHGMTVFYAAASVTDNTFERWEFQS